MNYDLEIVDSPDKLDNEWDHLAQCYFQKREFLTLLHLYNYCKQRYYLIYFQGRLVAGAVVYDLSVNLFTFSRFTLPFKMKVIGLPASVASPSLVGETLHQKSLIREILKLEKGWVLGMNFDFEFCLNEAVNLRTLPTIVYSRPYSEFGQYLGEMRHPYRRRISRIIDNFVSVTTVESDCSHFTADHYRLYLEIMKRTRTKLEILPIGLFQNLSEKFVLTTHYHKKEMLCWQICCCDAQTLFFFFGGMNYELRDQFRSYYNNLLSIVKQSFRLGYQTIDFGQTAEIAKMRLGGVPVERNLFLYHKNKIVSRFLSLMQPWITYSVRQEKISVFKTKTLSNESQLIPHYEDSVCSS